MSAHCAHAEGGLFAKTVTLEYDSGFLVVKATREFARAGGRLFTTDDGDQPFRRYGRRYGRLGERSKDWKRVMQIDIHYE